ncbi:MAG: hypothetical protein J6K45_05375 [Clostridia bacterium]|nr:hypothetical protein [Clostridia bacterium]
MKKNKIIILIVIILIAVLIAIGVYFGIKTVKINKYTSADEYEVKDVKIASIKSIVGEKKIKDYSYDKNTTEILTLTFEDADKEQTVKTYIDAIKDSGNYIEMEMQDSNKRQIACPDKELTTVQTEITENGFILTIEVGPGSIKVTEQE